MNRNPSLVIKLIWFVQAVFFLVSMMLTGLFALSLSGADFDNITRFGEGVQTIFLAILFILIGCCIDIGKYLFWVGRRQSKYFQFLSIILMIFSWLASCAFFMSSETRLLTEIQYRSPEYTAIKNEINSLQRNIDAEERLLNKRLGSSYHKQWGLAQSNADEIARLQREIAEKRWSLPLVGVSAAKQELETTRLFIAISRVLGISLDSARAIGYGVLALLLEVSTLGMISLAGVERLKNSPPCQSSDEAESQADNDSFMDEEYRKKLTRLTFDILDGKVRPVLRTIKAADYGLSLDQIRAVLRDLHAAGILDTDIRNSYKLSEGVLR